MADITIYRGDTVKLNLYVTQGGVAFDLTSVKVWFTAKNAFADVDGSAIFQKTTSGGGIVVVAPLSGIAQVTIAPTDTDDLPNNKTSLFYDAQVKDASDNIFTVAYGNLIVLPDVTRATT